MPSNAGVDATMQSQLIRLAEAQRQKEIQAMDQLEGNPLLQQKVLEVRNLRRGLVDHATRNLESAKITQASLNNRLAFTRGKIAALPSQNSRLENMTSDTKSVQEIATELEKEKRETSIAMAGLFKADYVVDEARLASRKPVAPNKIFVYGIVFVLGLGLPLSVLIGLEFLQMRVVKQQDIESSTTIPVLGTIVRSEKEVKVVNQETANSLLAESLRSIRVQFQYSVADDTRKVIGITSTRSGEGKSFCSANLSSTFALSGKRTLIIDLDLRKPDQMNYFQYDNSEGIFAYLNQGGDYRKLIQKTGVSNLDILPSGPPFFNPLDLIDSHKERLALLIEMLRSEYDYIILDTPPIGQASDYFILKQFVDFTVFVVRHNLTEITSLIRINELYETGQITDIAIAINDVKADSNYGYGRHNYGYGYGYAMQKK
ncbi:MAG: polysaccharide biosynthesis tyrosine autokinase [Bacteroidota bacterium]